MKKLSIALSLICGLYSALGQADTCLLSDQWFDPAKNTQHINEQFLTSLEPRGIMLLGEHHANPAHHLWQLETIQYFYTKEKSLAIGLEMLPRSAQPALDDWVQGKIEKKTFLERSQWLDYWSFNFDDYLPLLEFAQQNKIPLIALNVSHELLYKVKVNGWEKIPVEQREGIGDPVKPERDYVRKLVNSFARHNTGDQTLDKVGFKHFVDQQLLWDRAMAEAIQSVHAQHKFKLIISLMGSWHIIDKQGVPFQLNALGFPEAKTLVPWDENLDCELINPNFADGVYGLTKHP